MPILVRNLTLSLDEPDEALHQRAAKKLRISPDDIQSLRPARRSIDARADRAPCFVYDMLVHLDGGRRREQRLIARLNRNDVQMLEPRRPPPIEPGTEPLPHRPIIVGFGPAGMFAALVLTEFGYAPIVLERGVDVRQRHAHVLRDFYRHGHFHPESNLLFGEGGAGAYSDGKLYTRGNDPRRHQVLETLVTFGAKPDILIDGRPHVGSDLLPTICRRLRLYIEQRGAEIRFGERVDDFDIRDGQLVALQTSRERLDVGPVLLGIGHSARDTIRRLAERGVTLAAKPFQLGLRIEHPQSLVDRWQYRTLCDHPRLPPAEYHLVAKGAAGPRGDVFSFCMCPGGQILPTNEAPGLIATNGASRAARSSPFANAALVITVMPDVIDNDPIAGLAYQQQWEQKAFALTGGTYRVPVQRAADLLAGRSSDGELETSYPFGGTWCHVADVTPPFVLDAIRTALQILDQRLPGFAGPDALLTGPETRASAPLRIVRDETTRASVSTANLYPIGEGAGYAGGIVSAAIDGIKTAETIIARHAPLT